MLSELATREHHCRPLPHHLEFALWGERRRYRCDRGAACRVLAGAGMVNGAPADTERTQARQLATGLVAAEADWRRLTPPAKERQLQSWSKARQRAYPAVTWPSDEATSQLRGCVTSDLTALAEMGAEGLRGKRRAEAEGEAARAVRSLTPTGHQMGGGALLYLRHELDRLAADRKAAGQPVPQCPRCGQFTGRARTHECPASSGDVAATAGGDYQPPAVLADYYANLDDYGKGKLAERREYQGLGEMTRAEFAMLAAADPDATACYFSRDDVWAVQLGDTAYPLGRAELGAFAQLAAQRVATDVDPDGTPHNMARLAANAATPKEIWQEMLGHPHPLVRAAVASRRDADAVTLARLYNDALPGDEVDSADDIQVVRELQNVTVRQQAVRGKHAAPELHLAAQLDPDEYVRELARRQLSPPIKRDGPPRSAIDVPTGTPLSRYQQALEAAASHSRETRLAAVLSSDADPVLFALAYTDPDPSVRDAALSRWVAVGADDVQLNLAARVIPKLPASLIERLSPPLQAAATEQAKAAVAAGQFQSWKDAAYTEIDRDVRPALQAVAGEHSGWAAIAFRELYHQSYAAAEEEALQPVAHLTPLVRDRLKPGVQQQIIEEHFRDRYLNDDEQNSVAANTVAELTHLARQAAPLRYLAAREYHTMSEAVFKAFSPHWQYTVLRGQVKTIADGDAAADLKLATENALPLTSRMASAAADVASRTSFPAAPPAINRLAGVETGLAYLCQYGEARKELGAALSKAELLAARDELLASLGTTGCSHQEGVVRTDGECFHTIFYVVDEWVS